VTGPAERLAALGLTLPPVAAPVAAYVPAVLAGGLVYTSGQLPTVDGKLPAIGTHARSAVGVAELPLNAPVEVELIAQIRS